MNKKTKRLNFVLSEKEFKEIKKLAEELGLNVSAYIRLKALNKI